VEVISSKKAVQIRNIIMIEEKFTLALVCWLLLVAPCMTLRYIDNVQDTD
jgi:hypothetical protein